jgi:UDP-N-acetylmuramate--alanine ligase
MPALMKSALREPRMESRSASRFTGRRVHFIGIGGAGMSGLARMLLDNGAIVTGSEPKPNSTTLELAARGVKIDRDQLGRLLSRDIDLIVRTAAIPDHNTEFAAARKLGVADMKYAELLGQVMAERLGVAVAGTHGKSTTTAMISHALMQCGADPSFVVGGTVPQLGGGSRSGAGPAFIAEACEYDRSFHHLRPKVALILNIEEDHLDCYKNLDEIIESFRAFVELLPADGIVIANGADANVRTALQGVGRSVQTCALGAGSDWSTIAGPIENGCHTGVVQRAGREVARLKLSIPGEHNLMNATMAVAACAACGVEAARAAEAISGFAGVDRRMTAMGVAPSGATVIDDYGHHPTEIRATLAALRERYRPRRLLCVFQPHQHSRTRFLLEDFAASFAAADVTIVPDIFFVRDSEAERHRVSSGDLVEKINQNGCQALHLPEFSGIIEYLRRQTAAGDLVVTMGAGNVWEIGRDLVS